PGKKQPISDDLFQRILKEKMTEAEVAAILGSGKESTRAGVPKGIRELVWTEGKNSITIQFVNGRADGGVSSITSKPGAATSKSADNSASAPSGSSSEAELNVPKAA